MLRAGLHPSIHAKRRQKGVEVFPCVATSFGAESSMSTLVEPTPVVTHPVTLFSVFCFLRVHMFSRNECYRGHGRHNTVCRRE